MLTNIATQEGDVSPQSLEEFKLISQITKIDHRLYPKKHIHYSECSLIQKGKKEEDIFSRNKGFISKEKDHFHIYNANMEYFSQIHNESIDDDSLFETPNHLLAPTYQEQYEKPQSQSQKYLKRVNSNRYSEKESQQTFEINPKNKKEIDYAYKKDMKEFNVFDLPPKCSKSNSRASLSVNQQKRLSTTNIRKEEKHQVKAVSKTKYLQRQPVIEEDQNQLLEDDPTHFQFHTFKADVQENQISNSQEDKEQKKNIRKMNKDEDKNSLQCTFKPNILKKSSQMVKSTKNVIERLSTAGNNAKQQKKPYQNPNRSSLNRDRLEELSQPRRLKTQYDQINEEVPSFRPSLSKKSLEQMSNCRYDVATRNLLWQKEREQKIEKMRQQQQKQKERKENCTHSPSLCQYKGQNAPNLSKFGKEGISSYFERLSGANKGPRGYGKEEGKQNRGFQMNVSKQVYNSKGFKKQKYTDAVKQLHNRIMNLKI